MIEEVCSHIRDPTYSTAVNTAGGAAIGLALAYGAVNKEGKKFYFAYHRNIHHTDRNWSGQVWLRPVCPVPGLRNTGPSDVLASYSASFGRY